MLNRGIEGAKRFFYFFIWILNVVIFIYFFFFFIRFVMQRYDIKKYIFWMENELPMCINGQMRFAIFYILSFFSPEMKIRIHFYHCFHTLFAILLHTFSFFYLYFHHFHLIPFTSSIMHGIISWTKIIIIKKKSSTFHTFSYSLLLLFYFILFISVFSSSFLASATIEIAWYMLGCDENAHANKNRTRIAMR